MKLLPRGPEADTRRSRIDVMLRDAGWVIQDRRELNTHAAVGVAVREVPLKAEHGFADYLLFLNGEAVGAIEAKATGTTLKGVEVQTKRYSEGLPDTWRAPVRPLPFLYETTGIQTQFTNGLDVDARSRPVFSFHRPETLLYWLTKLPTTADGKFGTLRNHIRTMPALHDKNLRSAQKKAVVNLEASLRANRPRSLIQMATGSGKTFAAVTSIYRLIKHGHAGRVLFLVDRANLGRQALKEFQSYTTPDDGRKFTELYNVQLLTSNKVDPVAKVVITTIQRLFSMLKGEPDLSADLEEASFDGSVVQEPVAVTYNPRIPPEFFDIVFVDECHRSIYTLWRQVVEYFDAFLIGLTATPNAQTFGFFQRNLVMEYNHEQAVADGVNVPFDVYQIQTRITQGGSKVDAGLYVDKRDRVTREVRWEKLPEELEYTPTQLDRTVVAMDQMRTVVRTFRDKLPTEIFPGRTEVPKTIVYAKDDSHADDLVAVIREEFGKGNDFCQKITYKSTGTSPEQLIRDFRTSYNPRIVVTVDMIATGTDIRPIEIVWFMRAVKSRTLFEQMKGRGVRNINDTDLRNVTPDAQAKTHFVIVDAVGACDTELVDTRPLEKKPGVSFEKLLEQAAFGAADTDTVSSVANRLARLDRALDAEEKAKVRQLAGVGLGELVGTLLRSLDPDEYTAIAKTKHGAEPTTQQVDAVADAMRRAALQPLNANPQLRNHLVAAKKRTEQVIDTVSMDEVVHAGHSPEATERAKAVVTSFEAFIAANKDEIDALHAFYAQPYAMRLRLEDVQAIADAMAQPPTSLTKEAVWQAYEQLQRSRVKGAGAKRLITDVVPLVRFALHQNEALVPFPDTVQQRFDRWIANKSFTTEQKQWLEMMRDHVAGNLRVEVEDFEYAPFAQRGGLGAVAKAFGKEFGRVVEELNEVLVG